MTNLSRTIKRFTACALFLLALSQGQAALISSGTLNQMIPDGNPTGFQSALTVSGFDENVASVSVHLNVSGGYNGDLYVYLSYNNQSAVLLNRVGRSATSPFGYEDAGFSIILSDSAGSDVHTYGGVGGGALTGTWQPDGRSVSPQFVTDASSRPAMLGGFSGMNPNGVWTLFVSDMAGGPDGNQSTLVDWGLDVTPVPEPVTVALGAFAALAGGITAGRRWLRKRQARRVDQDA